MYGWGQNKKGQVGEVKGEDGQTLKIVPYPAAGEFILTFAILISIYLQ